MGKKKSKSEGGGRGGSSDEVYFEELTLKIKAESRGGGGKSKNLFLRPMQALQRGEDSSREGWEIVFHLWIGLQTFSVGALISTKSKNRESQRGLRLGKRVEMKGYFVWGRRGGQLEKERNISSKGCAGSG